MSEPKANTENCRISQDGTDGWSVWYGSVLIAEHLTREAALKRLEHMMLDEFEAANAEIVRAEKHKKYVVDQIQRIREQGPT